MSYGIGHRCGLVLVLLWLWHRPADEAPIWPLAWELPCAVGALKIHTHTHTHTHTHKLLLFYERQNKTVPCLSGPRRLDWCMSACRTRSHLATLSVSQTTAVTFLLDSEDNLNSEVYRHLLLEPRYSWKNRNLLCSLSSRQSEKRWCL